jgi:hypothetical protein
MQAAVEDIYREQGLFPAMRAFLEATGNDLDDREPGFDLPTPGPQRLANLTRFIEYDAPAVGTFDLDVDALRRAPTRVVPAGGASGRETWTYRCAQRLAEELGTELVELPGGHNGPMLHPRGVAAALDHLLTS